MTKKRWFLPPIVAQTKSLLTQNARWRILLAALSKQTFVRRLLTYLRGESEESAPGFPSTTRL